MKYTVVNDYYLVHFLNKVNELLKEGWELKGGVSTSSNSSTNTNYYSQALVKPSKKSFTRSIPTPTTLPKGPEEI